MRWLRIGIVTGMLLLIAAAFAFPTWGALRHIPPSNAKVAGSPVARDGEGTIDAVRAMVNDAEALPPQAPTVVHPAAKSSPTPSLVPEGRVNRVALRFLADVGTRSRPPTFRRKYLRDLVLLI